MVQWSVRGISVHSWLWDTMRGMCRLLMITIQPLVRAELDGERLPSGVLCDNEGARRSLRAFPTPLRYVYPGLSANLVTEKKLYKRFKRYIQTKLFFWCFFLFAFYFSGGNVWSELVSGVNKHRFHHCCRAARVAWVNETRFKDTVHKYARWLVTVAHVIFRARKTCLKCTKRARPYPKSRHYHNTIQSNNMLILKIQLPSNQ